MSNIIYLPKKIKVGYQERGDTYNGKLAYVIYIDEKGVVRKEKSWEGWRDTKIEANEFENEPTSGFVLNKKVGGYDTGWNHRQTYCRVYDPRGFEFEINIENLLYILENASSIKGKGLEGEFIYGWEGTELILVPVDSPDYKEIQSYSEKIQAVALKKFTSKELIPGAMYQTKSRTTLMFLGRFMEYSPSEYYWDKKLEKGKKNFFFNLEQYEQNQAEEERYRGEFSHSIVTMAGTLPLIGIADETPSESYAGIMDLLEYEPIYSPRDYDNFIYEPVTSEELKIKEELTEENIANGNSWNNIITGYINIEGKMVQATWEPIIEYSRDYRTHTVIRADNGKPKYKIYKASFVNVKDGKWVDEIRNSYYRGSHSEPRYYGFEETKDMKNFKGTLEEINEKYKLTNKIEVLKNGKQKRQDNS